MTTKLHKKTKKLQGNLLSAIEKEKKQAKTFAALRSNSIGSATLTLKQIFHQEKLDMVTLSNNLTAQLESVRNDSNQAIENILFTQAQVLQGIFHFAAERISHCQNELHMQAFTAMAMQANNATRKTLLALNEIKNPSKPTFIKQQNNAINQQINQGEPTANLDKDLKISEKKLSNELLNEVNYAPVDNRSKSQTGPINPPLEAVVKSRR